MKDTNGKISNLFDLIGSRLNLIDHIGLYLDPIDSSNLHPSIRNIHEKFSTTLHPTTHDIHNLSLKIIDADKISLWSTVYDDSSCSSSLILQGKIFDVALDLRKKSKTYGKCHSIYLSDKNSTSLLIPAGFAHGFCSMDKENIISYGISNYRSKNNEIGILWNDHSLKIKWPIKKPIISSKDKNNITFKNFNNYYS